MKVLFKKSCICCWHPYAGSKTCLPLVTAYVCFAVPKWTDVFGIFFFLFCKIITQIIKTKVIFFCKFVNLKNVSFTWFLWKISKKKKKISDLWSSRVCSWTLDWLNPNMSVLIPCIDSPFTCTSSLQLKSDNLIQNQSLSIPLKITEKLSDHII